MYENFLDVIAQKEAGTFDPTSVNWAVGENHISVPYMDGFRYENRVCIFMMGDGSEQVYGMFPLKGQPSPELWDAAERIIRQYMGVEHVIRGVG